MSPATSTFKHAGQLPSIITKLREEQALLIVCDACYLPSSKSDLMKRVVEKSAALDMVGYPHVLIIGRSEAVEKLLKKSATLKYHNQASLHLNSILRVDHPKCFSAFQVLRSGFLEIREGKHYDEGGSRLKQAKSLYPTDKNIPHPIPNNKTHASVRNPTAIRLHAFFASNTDNLAYSDPTGGFSRLAGMEKEHMPLSIRIAHDDIAAHLRLVACSTQQTELRSYRYCSTAKHWLSDDALDVLQKKYGSSIETTGYVPELTERAFKRIVSDARGPFLDTLLPSATSEKPETSSYRLGMGVRAIVQEEWQGSNPFERSVAHWRIANYLFVNQDKKGLLKTEFPYSPHWGRERFFFLGECIRNLVRSCDSVPFTDLYATESREDFPDMPKGDQWGCNPVEVLNYCFVVLFQRKLNGNLKFGEPCVFWSHFTGNSDFTLPPILILFYRGFWRILPPRFAV